LNLLIRRAIEKKQLEKKVDRLRAELQADTALRTSSAKALSCRPSRKRWPQHAQSGHRTYHGESGTGKELVARGIHYNTFGVGPFKMADAPFVAVNCGALPKDLIESELFGYKKGAFLEPSATRRPFPRGNGGTIFLDEIMEMSPIFK